MSLIESVRKQENLERRAGREEREELYRKAFGASNTDDDDGNSIPDIILEEAANVLSDIIG